MTLVEALRQAEVRIASCHIPDARAEAELLLMHSLDLQKADLYARLHDQLLPSDQQAFWGLVERRLRREPTAYILKRREFYGIDLYVDQRVLIPRPETELLVEAALDFVVPRFEGKGGSCSIADVGTGSGAIAIALALHLPRAVIYATDISAEAIEVAAMNCRRHGVEERVRLLVGDMLQPLPVPVDLIVANLPYIRDRDLVELPPEIRDFEPKVALEGGADGLDKVRRLLSQAMGYLLPHGSVMMEIGIDQSAEAISLVERFLPGSKVDVLHDLAGIDRVVRILT